MSVPPNANGPLARGAAAKVEKTTVRVPSTSASAKRAQALTVIGSIKKSTASQLRIAVTEWRGERRLELQETTRLFGETFFPSGKPLTLDIDKIPELVALLSKAVQR